MNFARDVVARAEPGGLALIERTRDGRRRELLFGQVAERAGGLAGTLADHGVGRGDVVMTLVGNRQEWVLAMVACFYLGAVALPCTEQLRTKDLAFRLAATRPTLIVVDERNRAVLESARPSCPVLVIPDERLFDAPPPAYADLAATDPCLITFTSGTSGRPKAVVHGQRYLFGQRLQAQHWLDARPGDLVWCTAASGWSKSARNVFIAPWLRNATALLHDARFNAAERLDVVSEEAVNVLCMAPTEYRVIANRIDIPRLVSVRGLVSAGEALNPEILRVWEDATDVQIRDGYGQTETGQLTGTPVGEPARLGSMGKALPGIGLFVDAGELVLHTSTDPTFFLGYQGEPKPGTPLWRTGDHVREVDGWFYFEGRADDVIISAGYRIGPFEVESALATHPDVADVAVVAAPHEERGSVVRAVVVLRDGLVGDPERVVALQDHVKEQTAPYKYPRIIDFVGELPKTESGKVRRAALRAGTGAEASNQTKEKSL